MKKETIYVSPSLKEMRLRVENILCVSSNFGNEDALDEGELK